MFDDACPTLTLTPQLADENPPFERILIGYERLRLGT